jgi:hypothetical protein
MALNLDTSGFSFGNAGGSDFNFDPDRWSGAFSSATDLQGGNTFIADSWDSSLGFLSDGLNIYKDYLNVSGKNPYRIPASMSPDQYTEQNQPSGAVAPQKRQVVSGVDNSILLLAGAALAVVFFTS